MGLLDILTTQGSLLTNTDGQTPTTYNQQASVLDPASLVGSHLDLDGQTPTQYINNLPG
jgi:hypothetical protein